MAKIKKLLVLGSKKRKISLENSAMFIKDKKRKKDYLCTCACELMCVHMCVSSRVPKTIEEAK